MINVSPIILYGDSGSNLWPLYRTGFPKQFLFFGGNESLFQQAAQRLSKLGKKGIQVATPLIGTGEVDWFLAYEQLRETEPDMGRALSEPVGRNTAPALNLPTLAATESGQDPILVDTSADQTVANPVAFATAMQQAVTETDEDSIVILGITPDRPATGYGYIKTAVSPAPRDLVVIQTPDAVLVADKSRSQDVKHIVSELTANGREAHTLHRKVHRRWGCYKSIDEGGASSKANLSKLNLKPASACKSATIELSNGLCEGTAEITNGEKVTLLTESQSTYIPVGKVHRLPNPGTVPLGIIEMQSGSYFGEGDIVRFEDNYERCRQ